MYILTATARRKNSKRHIVDKSESIESLRKLAANLNEKYIVSIYSGSWTFIEEVSK